MNPVDPLFSEPVGQALGWTLLHFVWQGTLVALLLAGMLYLLRHRAAQVRYAVACGALGVLLALPVITLFVVFPAPDAPVRDGVTYIADALLGGGPSATAEAATSTPERATSWQKDADALLALARPWLVLIWMLGVLTLSLRYLAGWTYTLHLRRKRTREVGQRWQEAMERLAQQMGVQRMVGLVTSARVPVPTVMGWLRPVILLPLGVFTGLTPRQVEMVIAHELAHIRRYDYLVNLLQAAAETVLFYHPAVWWISQQIRIEREHCCDDLVVQVCGDAFAYAEALTTLEHVRQAAPRLALAATGGSLLDRVRRLLEGPAEPSPRAARWIVGLGLVAVLFLSLHLSSALDGVWNKAHTWITGAELEETYTTSTEGRLFIHTNDERGVVVDHYDDGETHTVTLKGPEVTVEVPAAAHLVVDDEDGPEVGQIDDDANTITFEGNLTLEVWQGDKKLSRLKARDATVVYAMSAGFSFNTHAGTRPLKHRLLQGGHEETAARLEQLIFDDESSATQLDALDELRNLSKRTSLPSLINVAERHPRQMVRLEAVQWLGRLGDAYVVYTLERIAFEDRSFPVQMEALDALRNLPDKMGIPSLMKIAQRHSRAAMRSEAVQWLGRLGDNAADLTLERVLYDDTDASVQREALDALSKLTENAQTFYQIAEAHPSEAIRDEALQRAAEFESVRMGQQGWHRIETLHGRVEKPKAIWYETIAERLEQSTFNDASLRGQLLALDALKNLPAAVALPPLARIAERHGAERVRNQARLYHEALTRAAALEIPVEEEDDEDGYTWSQALADLSHASASRRLKALDKIEEKKSSDILPMLVTMAYEDPSLEVQFDVLDIFRDRRDWNGDEWVLHIAQNHPNARMRNEAVQSLDHLDSSILLPVLRQIIFEDADQGVQREALDQIIDIEDEQTTTALMDIAQRHPNARWRSEAVQSLGEHDTPEHAAILASIVFNDVSTQVQAEALDALLDLSVEAAVPHLAQIAQNHPRLDMRQAVFDWLDENQDNPALQQALRTMKDQ